MPAVKAPFQGGVQRADVPDRDASRPAEIADRIVDAVLAGRLAPGQRLGEQALADLFGCSRTLVREAMARLSARGMVEVNARRGWFVVQPSLDEAREAFGARQALETGLLHGLAGPLPKPAIRKLKAHVAREQAAIAADDAAERSWLLGDFHVCLAECAGNSLLADLLARCVRALPGLQLHISAMRPLQVERDILAGQLDAGIIGARAAAPGLQQLPLCSEPNSLWVAPGHPWYDRAEAPRSPQALAALAHVADPYGDELPEPLRSAWRRLVTSSSSTSRSESRVTRNW